MLSAAKKLQLGNFYFAGGLAAATGYQKDTNSISGGVIISPEISLGYKYLRIKTSAPFGLITNNADVINFQIVFNLN